MYKKTTAEQLREQTAKYVSQYQEQKRLSPDQIGQLVDETIKTQTSYIVELETSSAAEREELHREIRDLKYRLKWAEVVIDMFMNLAMWSRGTRWMPNERAIREAEEKEE